MLRRFLFILTSKSRRFVKKKLKICLGIEGEDKISMLPDDLLVRILSLVSTKEAVATMVLSKRWRFVWTMVPILEYKEIDNDQEIVSGHGKQQSIWRFLDESLNLNIAPVFESLGIELGPRCPVDADVGKWIANAVDVRKVRKLAFVLTWTAEPTSLPKSLYTSNTLVSLCLSSKIFVDVPFSACLPSLKTLGLHFVVYKDEESLIRLLSSCPILKNLCLGRHFQDKVTNLYIKVPSLECLIYDYTELGEYNQGGIGGSLVIDSPVLKKIFITDFSGNSCSIENKPRFDKALIYVYSYVDNKFMGSLSSLTYVELGLTASAVVWCNAINFSKLIECKIAYVHELDWLKIVMILLQNSPNLKILFMDQTFMELEEDFPFSWNQPSSVHECLLFHLEIFEWKEYSGRSEEKEAIIKSLWDVMYEPGRSQKQSVFS